MASSVIALPRSRAEKYLIDAHEAWILDKLKVRRPQELKDLWAKVGQTGTHLALLSVEEGRTLAQLLQEYRKELAEHFGTTVMPTRDLLTLISSAYDAERRVAQKLACERPATNLEGFRLKDFLSEAGISIS